MRQRKVNNLIFDLGGVIINLSIQKTIDELAKLGGKTPDFIKEQYLHHDEFKKYETGAIGDDEFRSFLRGLLSFYGPDADIDSAWNAMILDIPAERLSMLKRLQHDHQVMLLSNTNTIHMNRVREVLAVHGTDSFDPYFHKQYYSHLINKRKPDAEIYQMVLEENNIDAEDALFIDDNADNIKGAANLGIQVLHVTSSETLTNFFE
ncbi:Haloacid dehalogenase-like hydrolase [Fulvivirga imtechensis AK7]|uniref:Haloacid dehalogenase-like hydrolase n=1 Tax=Fulvivirga imtechensis AK7 TaxID=1237149 RepID=L8JJC1_9BACT|nr:HAD family phosphatase [Fulvivirga imtechensis]ELR68328.1 Haloacid dehalogenase-like hydrolase [Fulvivirga imtechensis AK7]